MRIRHVALAAVLFAIVPPVARAGGVAVVLLNGQQPMTVHQAQAIDALIEKLAARYGTAFTVSRFSAVSEAVAELSQGEGAQAGQVMDELRAALGAERVIVLRWRSDGVEATDSSGALGRVVWDKKSAAQLATELYLLCTGQATAKSAAPSASTKPAQAEAAGQQPAAKPAQPEKPSPAHVPASRQGRLLYERAVQSYRQGNYQLALDQLERALRAGMDTAQVLELQARIYGVLGQIDKQTRALEDLLREDPSRTRAAVALALLLDQEGLWQKAVDVLNQAIERRPKEGQLYIRLAHIYQRQGRTLKALEVLRRGYEATGDAAVGMQLAAALDAAGDWRGAMAMYSKLAMAEDARVRAQALDALGDLYARAGMLREAVEAYSEAAKATGAPGALSVRRYRRIYGAADRLLETQVRRAWQAFEDVAAGRGSTAREDALAAVQAAIAEAERVLSLAEGSLPPPELEKEHKQRKLYYALIREALVAAATFVDTGRQDMIQVARKRLVEAMQEKPVGE